MREIEGVTTTLIYTIAVASFFFKKKKNFGGY